MASNIDNKTLAPVTVVEENLTNQQANDEIIKKKK